VVLALGADSVVAGPAVDLAAVMPADSAEAEAATWVVAAAMEAAVTGKQGFRFFLAELISPKWDGLRSVPLFCPVLLPGAVLAVAFAFLAASQVSQRLRYAFGCSWAGLVTGLLSHRSQAGLIGEQTA
jgi:hypothetical protein